MELAFQKEREDTNVMHTLELRNLERKWTAEIQQLQTKLQEQETNEKLKTAKETENQKLDYILQVRHPHVTD